MKINAPNILKIMVLSSVITLLGCQALSPQVQGLPKMVATVEHDDVQAEIFWRDKSFAFLLSKQPYHDGWQIHALTLSGQLLFELNFDGKKITTVQKHDSLSALPVEFLIRDIWWATLPTDDVEQAILPLGLGLAQSEHGRQITEGDKVRLDVVYGEQTTITNQLIPYKLILSQTTQSILHDVDTEE